MGVEYLARNIPIAGVAIGADTNTVALYGVDHVACHFCEVRQIHDNGADGIVTPEEVEVLENHLQPDKPTGL